VPEPVEASPFTGFQDEVDRRTLDISVRSLPIFAVLFAVQGIVALATPGPHQLLAGVAVDFLSSALCVWLWSLSRQNSFSLAWANWLTAGLTALIVVGTTPALFAGTQHESAFTLALALVWMAYTYSDPWHFRISSGTTVLVVSVVAAVGWGAVAGALVACAFVLVALYASFLHRRFTASVRNKILEREIAVEEQAQSEENHEARVESAARRTLRTENDTFWYWDIDANKLHLSDAWAEMLGCEVSDEGIDPEEWFSRIHPYYLAGFKEELSAHLYGETEQFESEYRIKHQGGTYLWALVRARAYRNAAGRATILSGSHTDITCVVDVEKRLLEDAFLDRLTGLPNRQAFFVRLNRAFEQLRNGEARLFAVVFLDLDRFKVINDSLGHLAGDQLLAAAAARLKNARRRLSADIVARFGGDEFVALLEDLSSPEEALRVAETFRAELSRSFRVGEHDVLSGTSIGVAFSDHRIEHSEDLLRNADTAMYRAKSERKGGVCVFNSEMHAEAAKVMTLQNELGKAVQNGELIVHYQPLVRLSSATIVGAEALVRWRRSNGEIVSPAEFIPLAEETGLINDIGDWVLQEACRQNASWQSRGLHPIRIAVNISACQMQQPGFPESVELALEVTGLNARWLELELTETALMKDLDGASRTMEKLKRVGVEFSIDDFGTGYSSLGYLHRFAFDCLKMDKSFVAGLTVDEKSASVAKGLISLAHNLNLRVTAEGVESRDQLEFLRTLGCDQIQGYLISRPIAANELAEQLKHQRLALPTEPPTLAANHIALPEWGVHELREPVGR